MRAHRFRHNSGRSIRRIPGRWKKRPWEFHGGHKFRQALLRLRPSARAPTGLLALGSRVEGRFDPGQGTELLSFLARILELCIRTWLELPRE